MRKAAGIRVRDGGMDRLRQIAGEFGAVSKSGVRAGEASISELLDRVISGELVIVRGERTMERVNISNVTGDLDLYCQYARQTNPQDAYVALDTRDGRMWADYNAEIGNAVPSNVYHGQVRRYAIPPLKADTANALMRSLVPLAQRVLDGAEMVWNGNNHVTRLSEDAQEAEAEINQSMPVESDINVVDANEWLYDGRHDIKDRIRNGDSLEDIGSDLEEEARGEDVIINGLSRYLESLAEDVAGEDAD